jgi:hypothetical protein
VTQGHSRKALAALLGGALAVLGVTLLAQSAGASTTGEKTCTTYASGTAITESDFAYGDTRATGHYEFTPLGGLHIWTEGATSTDKVAEYLTLGSPISLAAVGEPGLDFLNTSLGGIPGFQLDVDNGHGVTGYVVGEPGAYGADWWSNKDFGVGAGDGYTSFGTLDDYVAANPDAVVTDWGFSLGSGVKGDGVLTGATFACVHYSFASSIEPPPPTESTTESASESSSGSSSSSSSGSGSGSTSASSSASTPPGSSDSATSSSSETEPGTTSTSSEIAIPVGNDNGLASTGTPVKQIIGTGLLALLLGAGLLGAAFLHHRRRPKHSR